MENNETKCIISDTQVRIIHIVYTALSFLSFVIGAASILINRWYYYRCKYNQILGILILGVALISIFELIESLNWLMQLYSPAGCAVLGAIREYTMISILVVSVCLGIHLLLLMTPPKCLQVIMEVKLKRYKMINRFYVIATLIGPACVVPWPFITMKYGKDGYVCWLAYPVNCNTSDIDLLDAVNRIMMWHFWAFIVWMFVVIILVLVFCQYCAHKSLPKGTKSKSDGNVTIMVSFLTFLIISSSTNALPFLWNLMTPKPVPFSLALQAVILTPLTFIVCSIIIAIGQICIKRAAAPMENVKGANTSRMATRGRSYGGTVTNFTLPVDDW